DYDEEFEQDDVPNHSEDPLASAMLLLANAITQNFSNPTNNRLRASSNTINQAVVQGDRVNIQSRNSGNVGRNNRRAYVQGEVVKGMRNTPKIGSQRNVFPGALLPDPIAQVRRERPLTESFEKKSCKFGLQCTSSMSYIYFT
ncbi:hypothetical protein Tco_0306038, partial [Tanacetum coccineum]